MPPRTRRRPVHRGAAPPRSAVPGADNGIVHAPRRAYGFVKLVGPALRITAATAAGRLLLPGYSIHPFVAAANGALLVAGHHRATRRGTPHFRRGADGTAFLLAKLRHFQGRPQGGVETFAIVYCRIVPFRKAVLPIARDPFELVRYVAIPV